MQYTICSKAINQNVQELVVHIDQGSSPNCEQAKATFYLFHTGERYPTEFLHESEVADLWLIQEELDECLSKMPGQRVWLDSFEKSPGFKGSASQALKSVLDKEKTRFYCKGAFEVFLNPHPIGCFDPIEEESSKNKLIDAYFKAFDAKAVSTNIYMFKI